MIEGKVNAKREAIVLLRLSGPISGSSAEIQSVIDTGFDDFLTLPFETIASLGLEAIRIVRILLADGTVANTMLFAAEVEWHGVRRAIEVQSAPGSPLLGMTLMEGSRLTMSVREDGPVLIEEE